MPGTKSQGVPGMSNLFLRRVRMLEIVENDIQMLVYFENTFKKVAKTA